MKGVGDAEDELDTLQTAQAEVALEMRGGLDLRGDAVAAQFDEKLGDDAGDLLRNGGAVELSAGGGQKDSS